MIGAKIILLAAEGLENDGIVGRVDLLCQIVSKRRKRFFPERLPSFNQEPRGGRPAPLFLPALSSRLGDRWANC